VNKYTAETILAALDAEREAGRARGFVDAMSEVTFGASALPSQPVD
jgi:hypothetical protein